jgi:hypothetical protein
MSSKPINLSLSPDLWAWIQKKADHNGLRIPTSRGIAHILTQVIEKEKREAATPRLRRTRSQLPKR